MPAIHRNRAEIREIFLRRMATSGRPAPDDLTDDPAELAGAARLHLREKFLRAKVGVSGANFAVAETGTLVVVESEGNGRMCLTLPEVLITVMGIEKVVPTWADLEVFLQLLPRSSTGERMNPYTSMWTGVTPGDGPQEVHVVLLDNGRTRALADEVGRQALRCIRCSACLNVCPVYERAGGHAYGSVYPGPIGAILTPLLHGCRRRRPDRLAAVRLVAVRRLLRRLPGGDRHPGVLVHLRAQVVDAHRERPPCRRRRRWRCGRPRGVLATPRRLRATRLGLGRARSRALGRASIPAGAAPSPAARAGSALDGGPRPAGAAAESFRAWWRRTDGGPTMSARDEILGRVRAALVDAPRRAHGGRAAAYRRPVGRRGRRSSPSGSRTTAPSSSAARRERLAARVAAALPDGARVVVPRRASASTCPGAVADDGLSARRPRRRRRGRHRAPASASPRPARSCSTTGRARAAGRSRWSPTCTSASCGPTRSSPTSPTPSPCSTRAAR